MHGKAFLEKRQLLTELKAHDPEVNLPKTIKVQKEFKELQSADRFAVLNRRTGWVATSEWLQKHITIEGGVPKAKDGSKCRPWILTVRIKVSGADLDIHLRLATGKTFRHVRCFGLQEGEAKTKLSALVAGYSHVLEEQAFEDAYDAWTLVSSEAPKHVLSLLLVS